MKRLIAVTCLFILITSVTAVFGEDTGTYRILDYKVTLTPRSDGTVNIDYYLKWAVTGGHIPWITVGTSNNNFTIADYGGAVKGASSASQGGWSGVRLDLDQDYQAGQTFEVSFALVQNRLFYADQDNYKLDFTPGWYDRAVIDNLAITVKSFTDLTTVKAKPEPSSVSGDLMSWVRTNLGAGERFSISVTFPKKLFPSDIGKTNLKRANDSTGKTLGIFFFVAFFILIMVISSLSSMRRRYSGGRIFYGGFPGFGGRGGGGGSGRSSSGGGGFGGRSASCACACVSCACACACAGGGGAGCSRKLQHTCPICRPGVES